VGPPAYRGVWSFPFPRELLVVTYARTWTDDRKKAIVSRRWRTKRNDHAPPTRNSWAGTRRCANPMNATRPPRNRSRL